MRVCTAAISPRSICIWIRSSAWSPMRNAEARRDGGIVIACGMARHNSEGCVAPVFERADQNMYENKSDLKERRDGARP